MSILVSWTRWTRCWWIIFTVGEAIWNIICWWNPHVCRFNLSVLASMEWYKRQSTQNMLFTIILYIYTHKCSLFLIFLYSRFFLATSTSSTILGLVKCHHCQCEKAPWPSMATFLVSGSGGFTAGVLMGPPEPRISGTKPTFSEHEKTFKKMVENDGFPGKMIYKCWVFPHLCWLTREITRVCCGSLS